MIEPRAPVAPASMLPWDPRHECRRRVDRPGSTVLLLLTVILDLAADAVFFSAPWSRLTTRILASILALLAAVAVVAAWSLGWSLVVP
jgi:hypothetical protein